ncbi:hypothetical protein Vafri_4310 [Volvox africanus]|uniref:Pentacotripeptide-repeat region of PRORP domain-containing protein n=1 Tax=Volvox africanus TaxID=51714 RepID=A0A8J4AV50_9CHLO|nr:hypothetical protein Vafri_4310 [Volvox africanus]
MLRLRTMGPFRAACHSSRRCGAWLLAPIAPSWSRPGGLLFPHPLRHDVRMHALKRGRPRKDQSAQPPPVTSQEDGEAGAEGEKPRKGRRSRKEREKEEARDLLESQQIDMEVLEEFKARAAAEEEVRKAAMGDASEDDPRRLNFHRSLLAASQRGLTGECGRIIESMADAGLPPGPRAIHVWAYSYIQIGDGPGARRIAEVGKEMYGISWIPETYVALMHGALSATPGGPDLMAALEMWVAQQDAGANPQLGFTFLAKELFRLRYSALAMQVVSEGYAAGLKPDEKLAALVIEQLCKQGLMEEARSEMQRLLDAGLLVGPEHYDTIVRLEAARGNLAAAREMLETFYTDQRFAPPRGSSYTALLKGLVSALRSPDVADSGPEEDTASGPGFGGRVVLDSEQLDQLLRALREEMVARGLRPGREAYAAMVEAFAVAGDLDSALATYETMTRAKGSPALMRKKYLGRFVVSLLAADRPIDALRLLRDCSTTPSYADARSCVTLPAAASNPVPGADDGGRSALTAWLPRHYEVMRQRKGQRASVLSFMRDADMMSRREVDGVVLGMGGCVVTEEGLWVPPAKMTLLEMRVELTAGGMDSSAVSGASRKELQKMIKDRREHLSSNLLEMQARLEAFVAAKEEEERLAAEPENEAEEDEQEFDDDEPELDTLDVNVASIIADEGTFEGGDSLEDSATFRAAAGGRIMLTDEAVEAEEEDAGDGDDEENDDDVEDDDDMEEGFSEDMPAAAGGRKRRQRRRRSDDDDDDAADDDEEDDELLGLEDSGAPPLGDGLGPTSAGPDDLDWEVERGREEGEDDAIILDQVLNMSVMDSSRYNESAGMVVAMRMLELWVAVGCSPTPADLMALYDGATLEEHPRCCADLAEQLPALLVAEEVSRDQLLEMLVTLANVCLRPGSPDSEAADRVVTVMEDNKLQVPADIYSGLEAALNGRPRMRDSVMGVAGGRVEADLTGSGLESSMSVGDEEDEEAAGGGVLAGVLGPGDDAVEDEGEDLAGEEEGLEEGMEEEAEEGEGDELDLYGEYEEDPAALEAEQVELQRLFQQDGEEDDAWLDELDEPADVDEVRAAAELEAAAAHQAEIVASTLEAVRTRSPYAAALLERQLAAMEAVQEVLDAAEDKYKMEALPAEAGAEAGGLVPYEGGELGEDEAEEGEEGDGWEDEDDGEEDEDENLASLGAMATEAEWDAAAVLELPPAVLAEAAAATEAEMDATVGMEEEDRMVLRRIAAKATVLAQLHAINNVAAAAHPDGLAAAEAEVSTALQRIQKAMMESAAATSIIAAAAAADGETAESLADAAADQAGVDAVGLELEAVEDEEWLQEAEEEGDDVLRPEHLEPGVDDSALDGQTAQMLQNVMAEAEALLAAEEEEAEEEDTAGVAAAEGDDFDGFTVGADEAAQDAAVLQRMLASAESQGPDLTEEQQEFYDLLERGDMNSLEAKVGPQVMAWLAEDLQRLAAQEEVELQEGPSEQPQEPEGDEDLATDAPELAMGWRLNDRFMATFAAVLRERAAVAAERGIVDDSPEVATVDALLAMANGYRPHGFDGGEEELEPEGEEEVDEDLVAAQQEAREALQRLEEEMGGPGEAAAREAAEQALEEVLAVQTERYEEAEATAEEAPRVLVRPWAMAAAEGAVEGRGEWEEDEGEEEEAEEGEGGFEVTEAVQPEAAAALLRQMRPTFGPVYVAEPKLYEEAEAEPGGRTIALAEEEPSVDGWEREKQEDGQAWAAQEQEEPPARGKGSGRGGASGGRPRKSPR